MAADDTVEVHVHRERGGSEWGLLVTGLLVVVAGLSTQALELAQTHRVAVQTPHRTDIGRLTNAGLDVQVGHRRRSVSVPVVQLRDAEAILRRAARSRPRGRDALSRSLNAQLERAVGPGRAYVVVNVRRNGDRERRTSVSYERRGTPLRSDAETLAGEVRAVGSGEVLSRYGARRTATTWARGTSVTRRTGAPGAIERMSVTLVVAPQTRRSTVRSLQRFVQTAGGLQRRRGDRMTVSRLPISQDERPSVLAAVDAPTRLLANPAIRGGIDATRWVSLGLAVLAFLGTVRRGLRRAPAATTSGLTPATPSSAE